MLLSEGSVWFSSKECFFSQTGHLRLWISNNYVVNNVVFLEQTNHFAPKELKISSQAKGINFMFLAYDLFFIFLTLT